MKSAKLPPPSYVAIDITYRCGLACGFCFVRRNGLACRRELGLAGWLRKIKELGPGRKKFYLTGGEPLLAPFLPRLVLALKSAGHSVTVTTALLVPRSRAAALAAAGPSETVVSVHGAPGLHERLAGKPGAWDRISGNLSVLLAKRPAGARVTLWCTVTQANHASLHSVYRTLRALGADHIAFNHLEFAAGADLADTRSRLARIGLATPLRSSPPGKIDTAALAAQIRRIKKEAGAAVSFYPDLSGPALRDWYGAGRARRRGFCRGQFGAAWFSPSGELLSCQPLAVPLAEAREKFSSAYNGPRYAAFRKLLLKSGGFFPACRRCGREPYAPAVKP